MSAGVFCSGLNEKVREWVLAWLFRLLPWLGSFAGPSDMASAKPIASRCARGYRISYTSTRAMPVRF